MFILTMTNMFGSQVTHICFATDGAVVNHPAKVSKRTAKLGSFSLVCVAE